MGMLAAAGGQGHVTIHEGGQAPAVHHHVCICQSLATLHGGMENFHAPLSMSYFHSRAQPELSQALPRLKHKLHDHKLPYSAESVSPRWFAKEVNLPGLL
jgi:hypothetical protein